MINMLHTLIDRMNEELHILIFIILIMFVIILGC
jgi:hypothetical protein